MKKILITLTLIVGCALFLHAKTPKDIFDTYEAETNAVLISLDKSMLAAMAVNINNEERGKLDELNSITMIELSECEQATKDRFAEDVSKLELKNYEMLARVTEDDQIAKVFGKVDGESVRDLVVIVTGKAFVLAIVDGVINMSDVQNMINLTK